MNPFAAPQIPSVTVDEVNGLVEEGAALIDIREVPEWNESRIPGAELKPLSTINDWWESLPTDRKVILYCRSGNRSAQAVHALTNQVGRTNVYNMTGGIISWTAAKLPVER